MPVSDFNRASVPAQPTVLVTGAAGFIGRRMLSAIRARGYRAIGLDRSLPFDGNATSLIQNADDWIVADITSDASLELPLGIDSIIHLAGKAHALAEVAQEEAEYARINTEGTRCVLSAAKRAGVRVFVLFSTVKAASDAPAGSRPHPTDESWAGEPDTAYGRSKHAAEELVLRGGFVQHPVVLRPCLVYGPSPKGNLKKMIDAISRGRFPPLPELGNRRSMVHVDDVITAALVAAENPTAAGRVYIVADNEPFSTRQLYEWICVGLGRKPPRWTIPLWGLRLLGHVGDAIGRVRGCRFIFDTDALAKLSGSAWYTSAKIQQELGWRPTRTLRASMNELLNRE